MKSRLRCLERQADEELLLIPQKDGTVLKFPPYAGEDALLNFVERIGAGDEAPEEHPLAEAARNSSDPKWSNSFFAVNEDVTAPLEDLSE